MADFRKLFYALAVVALLASLSAPAFAATQLSCQGTTVVPPILRSEGYTEMVGNILINCTGGTSTTPGNAVPRINVRVRLTANITSKLLTTVDGVNNNEALLIIDEPNSGRYFPNLMTAGQTGERPLLACGDVGASDNSASGRNVCQIIAPNHPSRTYDGRPNAWWAGDSQGTCNGDGSPAANSFGCGRPNVFQGHYVPTGGSNPTQIVEWEGIPFDPPGEALFNSACFPAGVNGACGQVAATPWVRTLRIVNLRVDANQKYQSAADFATPIFADVSFSGDVQAGINISQQLAVATGASGLNTPPTVSGTTSFVQCIAKTKGDLVGIHDAPRTFYPTFIRFGEGFRDAWRTRGWEQMQANSVVVAGNRIYNDVGTPPTGTFASPSVTVRQNVPSAIYHTEGGFSAPPGGADPNDQNPPRGTGNTPVENPAGTGLFGLPVNQSISNSTGIEQAGVATNGTRLQIRFGVIPSGVTLFTPKVVYLTRKNTQTITGIAILNTTTVPDLSGFTAPSGPSPHAWQQVGTTCSVSPSTCAVYEIMFDDPFSEEELTVPIGVDINPNGLVSTLDPNNPPQVTVTGGFAPAFVRTAPNTPSPSDFLTTASTLGDIPRFVLTFLGGQTLFSLDKCNCNLLFPFVSTSPGFDTGIVIANTSLDPNNVLLPVAARDTVYTGTLAQAGPVTFWYFGGPANTTSAGLFLRECTTDMSVAGAVKGTCTAAGGTKFVLPGQDMSFTLFSGSNYWGLNGVGSNFSGYMIAKTGFQYCHGFAYFSDLNRLLPGPGIAGTSVGYLALVMDPSGMAGSVNLNVSLSNQVSGSVTGTVSLRNSTPRTNNTTSDGLDQ